MGYVRIFPGLLRDLRVMAALCLVARYALPHVCHCCSAKQLVVRYPAMCVAAWAYITAALSMGLTALLFVERSGWEVPRQLLGPLVYWIFVCSVLGYYVVTWATQHLPASQAWPRLMPCVPHLLCSLHAAA